MIFRFSFHFSPPPPGRYFAAISTLSAAAACHPLFRDAAAAAFTDAAFDYDIFAADIFTTPCRHATMQRCCAEAFSPHRFSPDISMPALLGCRQAAADAFDAYFTPLGDAEAATHSRHYQRLRLRHTPAHSPSISAHFAVIVRLVCFILHCRPPRRNTMRRPRKSAMPHS